MNILDKANEIVSGSRNTDYGTAKDSFNKISDIASNIAGEFISPKECCIVLLAVKLTRESFKHKEDNLIDACGYLKLLNDLHEDMQ